LNQYSGVDGVDVVIGTSSFLREFSHGKDMEYITKTAIEVIEFVKSKGIEVRFSSEDSFRSDLVDLLSIYQTVDKIGVDRVGIADTVGCANPRQVYDLVRTLRGVVGCDIEIHLHNDTGMGKYIKKKTFFRNFLPLLFFYFSYCQRVYRSRGWCNSH
jgi:homocitrate synthase